MTSATPNLTESAKATRRIERCRRKDTQLEQFTERAIHWLESSGIQREAGPAPERGSFACWYEEDTQVYPFVYSEITGYLITMMCNLWSQTKDERYLRSAREAGDWLLNTTYEPSGAFRCLYPLRSTRFDFKANQIYTFDNGVILNGLVSLYRVTREERYLASAVTAADWLVYSAQKESGAFHPLYQLDEERFVESDEEWSTCSGSYHAKAAIGLLNLYDLTLKAKYRDAAIRICDFAMGCQDPSGRYVIFLEQGGTNAHPHCYTAEGLWVAGRYLGQQEYLNSSAQAVRWLLEQQSEEGFVPRLFKDGVPTYHERVDAIAQTLRLAVLHEADGRLPRRFDPKIRKLVRLIPRYQASSRDRRVDGGLYFGRLSSGEMIPHVNVWVTSFAVQAMQLYMDRREGRLHFDPFSLV